MQDNTPTSAPRKPRGKPFSKGFDPRRHILTPEEKSRGFWTAIAIHGPSIAKHLVASGRWPNYRGRRAA